MLNTRLWTLTKLFNSENNNGTSLNKAGQRDSIDPFQRWSTPWRQPENMSRLGNTMSSTPRQYMLEQWAYTTPLAAWTRLLWYPTNCLQFLQHSSMTTETCAWQVPNSHWRTLSRLKLLRELSPDPSTWLCWMDVLYYGSFRGHPLDHLCKSSLIDFGIIFTNDCYRLMCSLYSIAMFKVAWRMQQGLPEKTNPVTYTRWRAQHVYQHSQLFWLCLRTRPNWLTSLWVISDFMPTNSRLNGLLSLATELY